MLINYKRLFRHPCAHGSRLSKVAANVFNASIIKAAFLTVKMILSKLDSRAAYECQLASKPLVVSTFLPFVRLSVPNNVCTMLSAATMLCCYHVVMLCCYHAVLSCVAALLQWGKKNHIVGFLMNLFANYGGK